MRTLHDFSPRLAPYADPSNQHCWLIVSKPLFNVVAHNVLSFVSFGPQSRAAPALQSFNEATPSWVPSTPRPTVICTPAVSSRGRLQTLSVASAMDPMDETPHDVREDEDATSSITMDQQEKHGNESPLELETGSDHSTKGRKSHGLLKTKHIVPPENDDEDSAYPDVDVIHVAAICPENEMHDLKTLVGSLTTGKRELVLQCDMATLLAGDLTQDSIEQLSTNLLHELVALREDLSAQRKRRAIIFVAYDFGALVVKTAVSLAARSEEAYPGVFTDIARLVFSGCPQRSFDLQAMERMLFAFLHAHKEGLWSWLVNGMSIHCLANAVLLTNQMFLGSKITLRTRVISLHADQETPRTIHPTLDSFTATLGVPSEIVVQEQDWEKSEARFPTLSKHMSYKTKHWIPRTEWIQMEKVLLSRSSPQWFRMDTPLASDPHPILGHSTYIEWADTMSSEILYIHGSSHRTTQDMADQIFLAWRARYQEVDVNYAKTLAFAFDSNDPLRNNVPDMLASFYIQALAGHSTGSLDEFYHALHDWWLIRGGWTEASCLNLFNYVRRYNTGALTLFLLRDFDECSQNSRKTFLKYYNSLSERSELPLKILVTSRKFGALSEELKKWPTINVDECVPQVYRNLSDDLNCLNLTLAPLCPTDNERKRIREGLDKLSSMDSASFTLCLRLLQDHTDWPNIPSLGSLTNFIQLLDLIAPGDSPPRTLDKILKSNPDKQGLCWVLGWLLCSYRPLSSHELTTIFLRFRPSRYHEPDARTREMRNSTILNDACTLLKSWLRVLADFSHDQVKIKSEIRHLLKEDTETEEYIWNEARRTAHQSIYEYCSALLSKAETMSLLESAFQKYEVELDQQQVQGQIISPMLPDSDEIVLYAVQSYPYHLSEYLSNKSNRVPPSVLEFSTTRPSKLWAKTYWAMSNPFARTPSAPDSALPLLAGLGVLPYELIANSIEGSYAQCLLAGAACKRKDFVTKILQERTFPVSELRDVLTVAIQAGDESTALEIAMKMLSLSRDHSNLSLWPQPAIWAATWLNMDRLLDKLLGNGATTEPQTCSSDTMAISTGFFSSPLYMASLLGHAPLICVLLIHGARTDVLRENKFGAVHAAASEGYVNVIEEYLKSDPAHLKSRQPNNLLYIACWSGCSEMVKALLTRSMDPNNSQGSPDDYNREWTPLARACNEGFPKSTKALLEAGADPNSLGPYGVDTPLWFAAMRGRNLECVRHLLHHGGDPNHEHLRPPLIFELTNSDMDIATIVRYCDVLKSSKIPVELDATNSLGQTALMRATQMKQRPLVQWLLKSGADVNAVDDRSQSPLYFAVSTKNRDLVQDILESKPNLDIVDRGGKTILQAALEEPTIVELLLDAGANPDLEDEDGSTPINSAATDAKPEVVKLLIDRGANIHHPDSYGRTPIHSAIRDAQDPSLVRLLADSGAKLDETDIDGNSLLHQALKGPPEIIKILLEFDKSINLNHRNKKNETPLLAATNYANIECLKLLIKAGADINCEDSYGETALHNTVWYNNPDFLSALLAEQDIDVDHVGSSWGSPLYVACYKARTNMIPALLERGANVNLVMPNALRSTPLIAALLPASRLGRSEGVTMIDQIVRTLVRRGANVNLTVPGSVFYHAISAACLGAGVSSINFLLDEGASCQLADPVSGRIALHFAAANGLENFQAMLLACRGDIMVADNGGKNCLHWAAQFGNAKTVEFILSKLKNQRAVDIADGDGWTPLCWAMRPTEEGYAKGMRSEYRNHVGVVRSLLDNDANPSMTFQYGKGDATERLTPLTLARRCEADGEIIKMLENAIQARNVSDNKELPNWEAVRMRRYIKLPAICDICYGDILGLVYSCKSCPDYCVCTKCIASTATFHSPTTKHDGLPHNFERNTDYDEFKDPPLAQPETDGDEEMNRTSGVGSPLERHHSNGSNAGVGADSSGVEDEMEIDEYV